MKAIPNMTERERLEWLTLFSYNEDIITTSKAQELLGLGTIEDFREWLKENAKEYVTVVTPDKPPGLYNADGKALSIADVMSMLPTAMINRVEVIDENGRSYVNWKPTNRTELWVQDNGRTLKVFVSQIHTNEEQER